MMKLNNVKNVTHKEKTVITEPSIEEMDAILNLQ